MSNRWSYGPEGLREKPAGRWSDAVLPRWRDVQPLLIRSAGVVGIVATIMAVVSSDAWRLGGTVQTGGRNDPPAELASVEARPATILVSTAPEPATVPVSAAPELPVATTAEPAVSTPAEAAAPERVAPPTAAADPQAAPVAEAVPGLRTGRGHDPAGAEPAPLITASVPVPAPMPIPAAAASDAPAPFAVNVQPAPAVLAMTELRRFDTAPAPTPDTSSAWAEGAQSCPRDWVAGGAAGPGAAAGDCSATETLLASTAGPEQSALEAAAAEEALKLAALAPRIPAPRPDPDDLPKPQPIRVSSGSGWPGPPPNCPAGQRAKWHFVDRKAGTKEWYCR